MRSPRRLMTTGLCLTLLFCATAYAQEASKKPWLSNLRQLTFEGEKSGEGYFSPDGKEIVYQAVHEGCPHYQIYRQSLATGERTMVSPGQGMTTCAFFHPTDGTILFASTHLDADTHPAPPPSSGRYAWSRHPSFDLFTVKRDGTGLVRLTDQPGYDAEANYSADGEWIVLTGERDGNADIYVMRSDGTRMRRITEAEGYDGGPFFSPDGKQICFRGFRDLRPGKDRYSQVYVVGADGRNERQLTFNTAVNWAPYYHPNGDYLAYCTNMGGHRNFELVLLRLSDAKVVRLTTDEAVDIMPVFSPDGTRLMWTTTRFDGKSQLVIADFQMPPADAFGEPYRDDPMAAEEGSAGHEHRAGSDAEHDHETRPAATPAGKGSKDGSDAQARLIDEIDSLRHVAVLASDDYEGRRSGTPGCEKAAQYICRAFEQIGLIPAGREGYLDPFEVTVGHQLAKGNLASIASDDGLRGQVLTADEDWRPLAFSADATVEGAVVFAGYGITSPDGSWDDYAGLDVDGKIVLAFMRGTPDLPADPHNPHGGLGLYAGSRYKAFNASQHGAAGLILVADARQRDGAELDALSASAGEGRERIPVVQLRRSEALEWARRGGLDLANAETVIHHAKAPASRALKGLVATLKCAVERVDATTANVIAKVDGTDAEKRLSYIVIGAHYDHLGFGGQGSLAPGGGLGHIHNGADDNASGVAGILELAQHFKANPIAHSIVFMAFSGEEMGLLGSAAWVGNPTLPLDRCVAMINLDMIGRLGEDGLAIDGVDTWSGWRGLLNHVNASQIKMAMTGGAMSGRSDHASFIGKGVPSVHFFTGAHEDYHRPTDDTDKVNVAGVVEVTQLVQRTVEALDAMAGHVAFEEPKAPKTTVASGSGYGAWLGTIPSYGQESGGVKLQGASPGSPAETAGVAKDDVLVQLGTVEIDNIYDFTNALRSHKPGDTVELGVLRAGKRVNLTVTLGRR
ncbi:MAG: M28 family peptidase [Planctomycetes bacterium]|nr:M28 family peptidase [Planctomycetota bacterium]